MSKKDYEPVSPIFKETIQESRQRAKDILVKYGFKLLKLDNAGIHFTCKIAFWKDEMPILFKDVQELNIQPATYNSDFYHDLDNAEFCIDLENKLHIKYDNKNLSQSTYAHRTNYMDLIVILCFPTFLDYNEKIDEVIDIMLQHSIHKYMEDELLNDWFSFLVERYHCWSDSDDYKLYKMANRLDWDMDNYQIPMWI